MKQEWEAKHPGHCGLCGLPFKHCIHQDPVYMKEVKPFVDAKDVENAIKVKAKRYTEALSRLSPLEVRNLPPCPREWMRDIRNEFRTLSVWDHVLEDDVL